MAEITLGRKANGQLKKKYIYGQTFKEVSAKLKEALAEQQRGQLVESSRITVAEWLNHWVNNCVKGSIRLTTWESYETMARVHIIPSLGRLRLQKLTTGQIQCFLADRLEHGRADGKGGLSPKSTRYLHFILHAAINQAVKEGIVPRNVAADVVLPALDARKVKPLTGEEIHRLLAANRNHRLYPALLLELGTGIRRGELLALKWENTDLVNGTITIVESLVRTRHGAKVQEPKTKTSRRVIHLPGEVVKELKSYRKSWLENKMALGEKYNNTDIMFSQVNGKPLDPRNFQRTFSEVWLKQANLQKIRFHDLRHTHASQLLALNVHAKIVQERLGHNDIRTTLDTYSHLIPGLQKEAAEKIDSLLKVQ